MSASSRLDAGCFVTLYDEAKHVTHGVVGQEVGNSTQTSGGLTLKNLSDISQYYVSGHVVQRTKSLQFGQFPLCPILSIPKAGEIDLTGRVANGFLNPSPLPKGFAPPQYNGIHYLI